MSLELESFSPLRRRPARRGGDRPPHQVQAVVDDVASVQPFWAQLPLADRARYMRRAAQAIIDELDELAELLGASRASRSASRTSWSCCPRSTRCAGWPRRGRASSSDERIPLPVFIKQKRARFTFEPLGVVGVIAPWNYPWSIPFGEVRSR